MFCIDRTVSSSCAKRFSVLALLLVLLPGCSTRQVSSSLQGATAQRLVTYSLEKFVVELMDQPEFKNINGNTVGLDVFFVSDHPMLNYATQLIRQQLELNHKVSLVAEKETPQTQINVFFNSIATDHDSYGLTIPSLGLTTTGEDTINVLAVDMFHGVTEGYAVVKSVGVGELNRTRRVLVRIRADNVATPIVDFPVNQLE